jgi:hypothetical protein
MIEKLDVDIDHYENHPLCGQLVGCIQRMQRWSLAIYDNKTSQKLKDQQSFGGF